MTDIRKKHEKYVSDVRPQNRFIPSILSCAEVDEIFRELDEARGKVRQISEFREKWRDCADDKMAERDCAAWELIKKILKGGGR